MSPADARPRRRHGFAELRDRVTASVGPFSPARGPAEAALRIAQGCSESNPMRALTHCRNVAFGLWTPLDLQVTAFIEAAILCRDQLKDAAAVQRLFFPDATESMNHHEVARMLLFSALDLAPEADQRVRAEHEDGRTRARLFEGDAGQPPVGAQPVQGYREQAAAAGFKFLQAGMYVEQCRLERRLRAPSERLWPAEVHAAHRLRRDAATRGAAGVAAAWDYAGASNDLGCPVAALDGYLKVMGNPAASAGRLLHARIMVGLVVETLNTEGIVPKDLLQAVRQRHL